VSELITQQIQHLIALLLLGKVTRSFELSETRVNKSQRPCCELKVDMIVDVLPLRAESADGCKMLQCPRCYQLKTVVQSKGESFTSIIARFMEAPERHRVAGGIAQCSTQ